MEQSEIAKSISVYTVDTAVKVYLNSTNSQDKMLLSPTILNPFLKCLENMKRTVKAELIFLKITNAPMYIISKI